MKRGEKKGEEGRERIVVIVVVIRFQIMCTTSQLLGRVKIKIKLVSFRGLRPLDPRSLRSQAREKSSFPCPPLARGLVTPLDQRKISRYEGGSEI